MLSWIALLALALAGPEDHLASPPEGFVDLRTVEGVRLEVRYHTAENFTGAPIPGYGAPGAWLREAPAAALARVQARLAARGLGLLVYDAYRPRRGSQAMVAWAGRTGQMALVDGGYIARRSGHNRGNTIDLTLVDTQGTPLDMGSPWDTLTPDSHVRNATGEALANRMILIEAMKAEGWESYWREWWHFSWPMEGAPGRDVPYGCFEAPEGSFVPPEGWDQPGFVMPATWTPTPCGDDQLTK